MGDFVFAIQVLFLQVSSILPPPLVDPKVMQGGFGLIFYSGLANLGKINGEFLREFFQRIFLANYFSRLQPPQKNSPKFTPKTVGIPLQFHFWAFLGPTSFHAVFCAYGGDQHWYVQFVRSFVHNFHYLQLTFLLTVRLGARTHTHTHPCEQKKQS